MPAHLGGLRFLRIRRGENDLYTCAIAEAMGDASHDYEAMAANGNGLSNLARLARRARVLALAHGAATIRISPMLIICTAVTALESMHAKFPGPTIKSSL